jgi:uncharacterized protein
LGVPPRAVRVETGYPWQGRIAVTVEEAGPAAEWTLSLRVPQWCEAYTVEAGEPHAEGAEPTVTDGWLRIRRAWRPGDTIVLDLDMAPRLTEADPRVDAVRGCVAVERGPLVHCAEQVDQPGAPGLDDLVIDTTTGLTARHRPELLGGVTTVVGSGLLRARPAGQGWWPYRTARGGGGGGPATPIELTTIPYYAWGNREESGMRVWLPTH